MTQTAERLARILATTPLRLADISGDDASHSSASGHWSKKQILGHLIDSAANNHQRIVRAQLEENPAMPGYEQNRWAAVHAYSRREWKELIKVWQALNRQLLAAAEAVPADGWSRTLTVAGSAPLTLEFVFEDYLAHMLHHLRHIGIEVNDIKVNHSYSSESGAA